MQSKFYYLIASLAMGCLLLISTASATHQMGLDVTYECLDSCNYRISVTTYYDCTGGAMNPYLPLPGTPPPDPDADVNAAFNIIGQGGGCAAPVPLTGWVLDSAYGYIEVTPVCPGFQTACTGGGGGVNGVVSVRYYRDYNFCNVNCTNYSLVYDGCCRNGSITSGAANDGMYTDVTTINTALTPCNSSPVFANPPVPYLCAGQSFTFNQGAFDSDGDSLVYSLGDCFDDQGQIVGYNGGYSAAQPLGPGWSFGINSQTGDITLTPSPNGPVEVGVICVYVTEFRNGVQIGQVVRDMQITVINCGTSNTLPSLTNVPGTTSPLTNLSPGATANGLVVTTCACQEICFDIPVTDPDITQNTLMYWNGNIADGIFTDVLNPIMPVDTVFSNGPGNPPTARFCWVPTISGTYNFLLTLQDDGCPIIGQNQYTITLNVTTCSLDPVAITDRLSCYEVQFRGIPCGGNDPFTFNWFGDGGLSSNGETITHTYPATGTYGYSLTVTDSSGVSTTITDSITVGNTAVADAGTDITVCTGEVGTIGTTPLPGYSYQWTSPLGVGWAGPANPNTPQPNVTFNNGTTTPITLEYYVEAIDPLGCSGFDTIRVTYEPAVSSAFVVNGTNNNELCVEDTATFIYADIQQPGAVYTWNFDGGVAASNTGPGPHEVTWTTPGPKIVSLVVNSGDCPSDTNRVTITVNPIPTSTFILDDTVCVDEFTQLIYAGSGSVGATFDWQVPAGTPSTLTGIGPHNVSWPTSGFQQVSLTVEENGCVSPTTINTTLAVPIPENSFIILDSICVGESVTVSYSGSAPPTSDFSWNFGDATVLSGTGVGPYELVWNTPGARNVCLQVGIGGCNSLVNCQTVEVLDRPVALIDPVADQCFPGNSFDFTYTILGGAADVYQWNFGPSAVPPVFTGPTPPTVTYQSIGPKTVELLVFSNGCQAADTAKVSFEVKEPPTADFTYSSGSVCADTCVTFNYAGVDNGQIFVWDFGSGAIPAASSVANPGCIQYTSGGIKTVTLTVIDGPCTITTTQQVSVNNGPAVNAGLPKEFCEGDGGVELDGTVTGGEMPYFYEWWCDRSPNCGIDSVNVEDPRVNPDVTNPTEEVVYYFQVTDVNGCRSNIDSVVVTVKAKPVLNAGPDLSICAPNAPGAFLQGSEADNNNAPLPITYAWSPSTGLNDSTLLNPFARPESTTIYTLTGTSVNGCSSVATTLDTTSSMTLTVLPKPRAIVSADTGLCVGESLELEGFAEGAGPDYTYTWTASPTGSLDDPNSSTPIVTPTQATTYTLVVTSNGCDSDGDTVRVEVDTKPTIDPGTNFSACKFEEVLLDARASGDPRADSYSYQWSPAAGLSNDTLADPIATPDESTIYTVFAVSEFGCSSDTAEVELTLKPTPEVDLLAQDTSICGEFEMTLTAVHSFTTESSDQVNYQWFPEDFAYTNIFDSVVTVVPTRTGYLTVEAIVSSGDCPTRDSIFVAVAPALEAIASADTSRICAGQTIGIYAEGGNGSAIFEWAPATGLSATNGTELQANPDTTTEYILTVTEGICVTRDTLRLEVNPTPEADYFTSITTGCGDLEVSFFSNSPGAIAYVWDFGDGTEITNEVDPVHFYEAPGTYTVTHTAIGIGGCESVISRTPIEVGETTASDFVSVPTSDEELPVGTAVIFEEQATGEVSYLWDFGDGGMERIANPTHTFERPGDYIVTLITTDSLGCTSTASYGPYVIIVPDLVLQNVFSPNGDGINDEFQIPYPGDEAYTLVIYDRWGREVFSADSPTDVWNGNLASGSPAREGVYRYTLRIGDQTYNSTITLLR